MCPCVNRGSCRLVGKVCPEYLEQAMDRYALSPMRELWTLETQYGRWLEVELAALHALESVSVVPQGTYAQVQPKVHVDVHRTLTMEKEVGHDLVAFLWVLEEQAGPEGRWFHYGLTSSDVKDTALALVLRDALDLLRERTDALCAELKAFAKRYRRTPMLGRTHGQWAEPTTLGLKALSWLDMMTRAGERLGRARDTVTVGKLAGAVGTYAFFPPKAEEVALDTLGLRACVPAGQVVPRERHAEAVFAVVAAGAIVETIALEVRHLSRTEVGEVSEFRPEGSSAMPHKQNPILSERLCGLARLLRSCVGPALENIPLWNERDMSHSSVERVVLPQAFTVADFMLTRARELVTGLEVREEDMRRRITAAHGLPFSEGLLLALVRAGMSRREAHSRVRRLAMRAVAQGRDLAQLATEDPQVTERLSSEELAHISRLPDLLRQVDTSFRRMGLVD